MLRNSYSRPHPHPSSHLPIHNPPTHAPLEEPPWTQILSWEKIHSEKNFTNGKIDSINVEVGVGSGRRNENGFVCGHVGWVRDGGTGAAWGWGWGCGGAGVGVGVGCVGGVEGESGAGTEEGSGSGGAGGSGGGADVNASRRGQRRLGVAHGWVDWKREWGRGREWEQGLPWDSNSTTRVKRGCFGRP